MSDENVGPASSAFYLGIFYTMAIGNPVEENLSLLSTQLNTNFSVGPAIGYSVGGHFLTFHTDFAETARCVFGIKQFELSP